MTCPRREPGFEDRYGLDVPPPRERTNAEIAAELPADLAVPFMKALEILAGKKTGQA